MVCTDAQGKTEGFWGVDHLGQVAQFLGLEVPGGARRNADGDSREGGNGNPGWKALL